MSDSLASKPLNAIDFLRLKAQEQESQKSIASSRQSVDLFCRFVGGADISFADFDHTLLGAWAAYLLFNDYTPKTVAYYIKRLSALYSRAVEAGLAPPTDAFSALRAKLADLNPQLLILNSSLSSLRRLTHLKLPQGSPLQVAKEMLLYALLNGGLTFHQIATAKKSDQPSILSLTISTSPSGGKYLFPLDRSNKNLRQQIALVEDLFRRILTCLSSPVNQGESPSVGLRLSPYPTRTAIDLWAAAAMSCGVSPQDISSCLADKGATDENLFTYLVPPSPLTPVRREEILAQVASSLTDDPFHWYVMHFRRHVDYDSVDRRLRERGITLQEVYYPMEEILRKVSGKRVFESRPVISWLMFFRQRASQLNTLFREIGDLAWGYRRTRDLRSPYAIVSDAEIREYKMALGTLDSDTILLSSEQVELQPGDRLIILGGLFNGRPATFERVARQETTTGRTICRILLDGGKSRDWIVEQDLRLLKKITEDHYGRLASPPGVS